MNIGGGDNDEDVDMKESEEESRGDKVRRVIAELIKNSEYDCVELDVSAMAAMNIGGGDNDNEVMTMSSRDTAAELANPSKRRKLNSKSAHKIPTAKYRGRYIHNIEELIENVAQQIMTGKLSDICCLCFQP